MARKPAGQGGQEVTNWQKEMAEQAKVAAEAQRSSSGGGKFFSMKSGVLAFDDAPLPGNQMAVVVYADTIMNAWYEDEYDPSNPASPKCFAFGHDEDSMEPHENVDKDDYFVRQNDVCEGCPQNEWGSARTGRGKACKNGMRLAIVTAGRYVPDGKGRNAALNLEMFGDPEHFAKSEVAYLNLPVMSVRNWSTYVKQVAGELGRPPHAVFTNVYLEPDAKSQFKVCFELLDTVPDSLMPTVMTRHKKEESDVAFPYSPPLAAEEAKPAAANNKLRRAAKPAAKKGR